MRKWRKIEYFHPEGKRMPNGINYQRGWFSKQCRDNMEAFAPIKENARGILVLPAGSEVEGVTDHLFTGRFEHGATVYDASSPTIEIIAGSAWQARKKATQACVDIDVASAIMKIIPSSSWYDKILNPSPSFWIYGVN